MTIDSSCETHTTARKIHSQEIKFTHRCSVKKFSDGKTIKKLLFFGEKFFELRDCVAKRVRIFRRRARPLRMMIARLSSEKRPSMALTIFRDTTLREPVICACARIVYRPYSGFCAALARSFSNSATAGGRRHNVLSVTTGSEDAFLHAIERRRSRAKS